MIFGMALGAALTYLLDPQLGARRRGELQRKLSRAEPSGPDGADAAEVDLLIVENRAPVGVS